MPRSGDFPGLEGRVEDAEVVLELWHAEEARPVVEVEAVGHAGEGGVEDCGEEGEGEFAGEVGAGFVEPVEDHFCLILIFFFSFFFWMVMVVVEGRFEKRRVFHRVLLHIQAH